MEDALPRGRSVTFHRSENTVPVLLFSGDPRRSDAPDVTFPASGDLAPPQTTDDGNNEDSREVGGLRRCSASFKLMGFEPHMKSNNNGSGSDTDTDDSFDPTASPSARRNLVSSRAGARIDTKDVRRYRNSKGHHSASDGRLHQRDDENRFAKWADLTDDLELPHSFLRQCAEDFDKRLRLLSELVLFIIFLLLFVFFVVADNSIEELYYNGAACTVPARQPIPAANLIYGPTWGPTFESTHTIINVSDWLERVVVPAYWINSSSFSNVYRLVLGNNVPLGALIIRIQRRVSVTPVISCATSSTDSNTTCTLSVAENRDTQRVGRKTSVRTDDMGNLLFRDAYSFISYTPGEAGSYDWSGNTLVIPFSLTFEDALATMTASLRPNATAGHYGITDPSLQSVSVVATTFNPPLQYFARTEFLFEVPSSGVAIPSVHFWPFFIFTTEGHKGFGAYTVIFFVYSLLMAMRWLLSVPAAFRRGRLLELLSTIWFYVEAANLVALFVVFVIRFIWWSESDSVAERISIGSSYTYSSNADLLETSEKLEYMASLYRLHTELNAINTVLFFLLILKYTSLHPTLERVTIAMRLAQQSIVGLFAVFVAVLLAFAICGNALFGSHLGDYRSIDWSFSSLMRMLLGDTDFAAMQDVNRVLAGLFYWAFLILGLFISLNFIMAVIAEALNHSERESTTVFYVPLKQQYLLFVDNAMMQIRRMKAAVRVIRQHQRRARAQEKRNNNSISKPADQHEQQQQQKRGSVDTIGSATGKDTSTASSPRMSKWALIRELTAEWGVYLKDGFRAMLVGASAVALIDCDENGHRMGTVLSFLTNTRYTHIVAALDDAHRCALQRSWSNASSTRAAAGRQGAQSSSDPSTSGPLTDEDGFTTVAMMVHSEEQIRKSLGFVEFASTIESFMSRRKRHEHHRKHSLARRLGEVPRRSQAEGAPAAVVGVHEPITSPTQEHSNSSGSSPTSRLGSAAETPTATGNHQPSTAPEIIEQQHHRADDDESSALIDRIDKIILETDFVQVLFNFWQDAANQYRMYQRSHAARAREEVQHAAWEASTRAIETILEEVLGAGGPSSQEQNAATSSETYPVLRAAASGSTDVIRQINRTAKSIAATGKSVERLTSTLSSRFAAASQHLTATSAPPAMVKRETL
ncbi:cation channel protein, putative [Bodo saltans]|uniref:Cation channel protein, putative n=1 Tax=Bodo saltans TaxID=75058 RepID=A0A0S4JJ23_BODSA|nr:cation channel protein, putative [Bodo saltans]|eukprot:CUG90358.1 cation channel protein, putative [Bodo saltans]